MRVLLLLLLTGAPLWALPTMIRLGYPNCISCHVNPQGGGLLNRYGKGIDEAQSRRGAEYSPTAVKPFAWLDLHGRVTQDLRGVATTQVTASTGGPILGINRGRFFYRNVTQLGKGLRVSATVNGETDPTMRRTKPYEPNIRPGLVFVGSLMLSYRPKEGVEFGVGRDVLPQGLIIPDQTTYIKARNRLGYYDVPTQAKGFFWGKRWLVSPFAYKPSYRESALARESGGGILAEFDLLGKGKTIVGFNGIRGTDRLGNRTMAGAYTRLGFGSWGVLAEHDFTGRHLRQLSGGARFGQQATYAQVFRYWREWLITSAIVERLTVERPYAESLMAYKMETAARLSSNWTIGLRAGVQRDQRTGTLSPLAALQLAMKTVN